ncbi:xylulokinase [Jatrophihabitans fulvus]
MPLVAGVDSSTQACKVLVVDADSGEVVRSGRAAHPDGVEVDPAAWERALHQALEQAGGLDDVEALAVAGQQHGMVALDADGSVVRPAALWNDTRAAAAALDLVDDLGGPQAWADAVGSVPVASFTASKLRWLANTEPDNAARVAAVCLPHDWLTWRLAGAPGLDALTTDRGDASGTAYWSSSEGWRQDLVALSLGHEVALPRVLGPSEAAGRTPDGVLLGAGTGDNAAAVLGIGAGPGEVLVSIGTSGVACVRAPEVTSDPTGIVAGFASASGDFLPLVCTLNAARVLDAAARLLGVDHDRLSALALECEPGAGGLVLIPYLEGERTPNLPDATGTIAGLTLRTARPEFLARAAVEGLLCGLADAVDALPGSVSSVLLVGGGARSLAVQRLASGVFGRRVSVPAALEYVALGAARQAAWALSGAAEPPQWQRAVDAEHDDAAQPAVRERYASVRPV